MVSNNNRDHHMVDNLLQEVYLSSNIPISKDHPSSSNSISKDHPSSSKREDHQLILGITLVLTDFKTLELKVK